MFILQRKTIVMKCRTLIFILSTIIHPFVFAQSASDQAAVEQTVRNLFVAMEKGDSVLARKVFTEKVTSATVAKDKSGNLTLKQENGVDDFITAIGSPHAGTWFEEAWNMKTQIDGDFAQIWCDYAFYLDKRFSHCGVDAFHLVRTTSGWKIFHIADTRRKTDCIIPDEIKKKHE